MLEETGYDIGAQLREEDYLEVALGDQDTKLFIIQVRVCVGWRRWRWWMCVCGGGALWRGPCVWG